MAFSGPLSAGSGANDASFGAVAWSNPGNITAADATSATANPFAGNNTNYLVAKNFGFALASGVTVDGIVAEFRRSSSGGTVKDVRVRAIKAGTIQATDKSTGTFWGGSLSYDSYGASNDLWGTTWTYSDINNSGFGVALAAQSANGIPDPASVDHVRLTVYYTASGVPASGSRTLFIAGSLAASGSMTLYLKGLGGASGGLTLFAPGYTTGSGNRTLLVGGHATPNPSGATAYIFGLGHGETGLPLYVATNDIPSASGGVDLFLNGSNQSGLFKGANLFIYADESGQIRQSKIPLTIFANTTGSEKRGVNLWTQGENRRANNSVPLVAWNAQSGLSLGVSLYASGQGITAGAMPAGKGMNLFFARNPSNSMSLYTQGPGTPMSGGMSLWTRGGNSLTNGTSLSMAKVVGGKDGSVRLYSHGW